MSRILLCLLMLPLGIAVCGDEPHTHASRPPVAPPVVKDPHTNTLVAIEISLVRVDGKSLLAANEELTAEELSDFRRLVQEEALLVKELSVRTGTLHQVPATLQLGQTIPVLAGVVSGPPAAGRGPMTNRPIMERQTTGTLFDVTPTVLADGTIALKVQVESSEAVKVRTPLSTGPEAETLEQSGTSQFRTSTTVKLTSGRTLVASALTQSSGDKHESTYLLVSATLKP